MSLLIKTHVLHRTFTRYNSAPARAGLANNHYKRAVSVRVPESEKISLEWNQLRDQSLLEVRQYNGAPTFMQRKELL